MPKANGTLQMEFGLEADPVYTFHLLYEDKKWTDAIRVGSRLSQLDLDKRF